MDMMACFQCADKLLFAPKACLQSVDTLWIASKHAEGMSLRYDAICVPVYCG